MTDNIKKKFYFKNDIGEINGKQVFIEAKNLSINLNQIANIRIVFNKLKYINFLVFCLSGLVFFIPFCFKLSTLISLFFVLISVVLAVFSFFYPVKVYFIQIVLCEAKQELIPVKRSQTRLAREFVKELVNYKESSDRFMFLPD